MRVLVVGSPRSATTWVGAVLGASAGAGFVSEPDSPLAPFAIRAMAGRGNLPVLGADDPGWPELTRLWDAAFGARRVRYLPGQFRMSMKLLRGASVGDRDRMESPNGSITPRLRLAGALGVPRHLGYPVAHHVVKSVRVPLMIDWLRARWSPTVVICFRHPLEVVASSLELDLVHGSGTNLLDRTSLAARSYATDVYGVPPPTGDDPVPYVAWWIGLIMSALDDARRAHPEFHVVDHERVCEDPVGRFRELVAAVGLEWSDRTEAFVVGSNRPGSGYRTQRVASEQRDRWRQRLAPDDVRTARRVLAQFPISTRYEDDLTI